jgi:transposase
MKRYVEGRHRAQVTLLPETLDEYVREDNPVRAVDAFVEELDLVGLGFERAEPADTGRPAYHPADLLKIYIYGYLNRIPSSRRPEREAQRNVELMWLTSRLVPDFKTIADFRRDNGAAIRKVCREFVELSRQLGLFGDAVVAIDGSKFKAINNRDKNFTPHKLKARMQQLEESIARYLNDLDRADREPASVPAARVSHLKEKIATVKEQVRRLRGIAKQLQDAPDQQVSLTDPDARSMATSGRGTGIVGYNVQAAVDTTHHMIVAHEVTNVGHDRSQLTAMSTLVRDAIGEDRLMVLADRGYFDGEEILKCGEVGIMPLVPKPITSNSRADGRFDKRDFIYNAKRDEYRCPAGERAIWRMTTVESGRRMHRYWPSACPRCPIKSRCTPSDCRRVASWEHEQVLDDMQRRLDHLPQASRLRRQTAEHPFATLKAWMGSTHFLTKTLPRVRTEMSLQVLAYNLKRALNIPLPRVVVRRDVDRTRGVTCPISQ